MANSAVNRISGYAERLLILIHFKIHLSIYFVLLNIILYDLHCCTLNGTGGFMISILYTFLCQCAVPNLELLPEDVII